VSYILAVISNFACLEIRPGHISVGRPLSEDKSFAMAVELMSSNPFVPANVVMGLGFRSRV
jgi:hypothetical protein